MISIRLTFFLIFTILVSATVSLKAQNELRDEILKIVRDVKAQVGVGIKYIERGDTLMIHGNYRFPMQSVYKFHLALAVLDKVDRGELSLDQKVIVSKEDMHPGTWSPIAKKHPEGNVSFTLKELIMYSVAQSDNNACDVLFRLVGGPSYVDAFIRQIGVNNFSVVYTEVQMGSDWDFQFKNWSTPRAMIQLLDIFFQQKILSRDSHKTLMDIMEQTITGNQRIKGMLPKGTIVQHKTGMGARDDEGLLSALNDVGYITLANGEHAAVAFFITNAPEDAAVLETVIAKISRLVYEN